MKKGASTFVVALILGALFGLTNCTGPRTVTLNNKQLESTYNQSSRKWSELKEVHQNSYEYTLSQSSVFGWSATTTVKVMDGKIVGRTYYEQSDANADMKLIYTETADQINSNQKGERAVLFDELYRGCAENTLTKDEQMHNIYLETDDRGLLSSCSSREKNCADDCNVGFYVQDFKWLK